MGFEKDTHLLKNFNPNDSIRSKDKLGYLYVSLSSILFGISFFLTNLAVLAIGPSFSKFFSSVEIINYEGDESHNEKYFENFCLIYKSLYMSFV